MVTLVKEIKDLLFFFLLTIFFPPYGDLLLLHRDHGTPEKGPDIVSHIDYDICGYHTPISGHPILVPDIDTDIGISCH
jgi:hypothetical protein